MTRRITICFVLLLTLSFSGATTLAADQTIPADPPVRWWKGNLHTHTFWSDGDDFPEMVAEWYRDNGYNFLGLSDHNVLSQGQRWRPLIEIQKRAGNAALEKYLERFGSSWVEQRENNGVHEVRLKPLTEFRCLVEERNKFIMLQAEEITDRFEKSPVHMNASNLLEVIKPQNGKSVAETIENNFKAVHEQAARTGQEILPHLNHPNFGWGVTAEDLAGAVSDHFFEIFNGHPGVNQRGDGDHPSMDRLWDIASTLRIRKLNSRPLYGLGTDDSHHYHYPGMKRSMCGRGWIMVRARHLTPESLIRAIKAGDFYASSGVTLKDVKFENNTLSIEIQPLSDGETFITEFVGTEKSADITGRPGPTTKRTTQIYSPEIGKTFAKQQGPTPSYKLTGNELYVRAIITSSKDVDRPAMENQKKQAWTQPVGWTPTGAP